MLCGLRSRHISSKVRRGLYAQYVVGRKVPGWLKLVLWDGRGQERLRYGDAPYLSTIYMRNVRIHYCTLWNLWTAEMSYIYPKLDKKWKNPLLLLVESMVGGNELYLANDMSNFTPCVGLAEGIAECDGVMAEAVDGWLGTRCARYGWVGIHI